jgi:hypothetical protein
MMKLNLITICLCIFCVQSVFSQTKKPTVLPMTLLEEGDETLVKAKVNHVLDDGRSVDIMYNRLELILDTNLKIENTKTHKIRDYYENCRVEKVYEINQDFYLKLKPRPVTKKSLFFKIDLSSLNLTPLKVTIGKRENRPWNEHFMKSESDNKYFLSGYIDTREEMLTIRTYGTDMKRFYEKRMPISGYSHKLLGYEIDSEGNAYVILKYKEGRNTNRKEIIKLYVALMDLSEITEHEISTKKGTSIGDFRILAKVGSGLFISGQYYDENIELNKNENKQAVTNNVDYINRLFFPTAGKITFSFDNQNGFSEMKYYRYPKEVLKPSFAKKKRYTKVTAQDMLSGIPGLKVNDMIYLSNGNIAELSEVFYSKGYTSPKKAERNAHFLGKTLLTVLSPEGEIQWIKSIDKFHRKEGSALGVTSEIKATDKNILLTYVYGKENFLCVYDLETGNEMHYVFDNGFDTSPSRLKVLSDQTVVVNGWVGKDARYGKLEIK